MKTEAKIRKQCTNVILTTKNKVRNNNNNDKRQQQQTAIIKNKILLFIKQIYNIKTYNVAFYIYTIHIYSCFFLYKMCLNNNNIQSATESRKHPINFTNI